MKGVLGLNCGKDVLRAGSVYGGEVVRGIKKDDENGRTGLENCGDYERYQMSSLENPPITKN